MFFGDIREKEIFIFSSELISFTNLLKKMEPTTERERILFLEDILDISIERALHTDVLKRNTRRLTKIDEEILEKCIEYFLVRADNRKRVQCWEFLECLPIYLCIDEVFESIFRRSKEILSEITLYSSCDDIDTFTFEDIIEFFSTRFYHSIFTQRSSLMSNFSPHPCFCKRELLFEEHILSDEIIFLLHAVIIS